MLEVIQATEWGRTLAGLVNVIVLFRCPKGLLFQISVCEIIESIHKPEGYWHGKSEG